MQIKVSFVNIILDIIYVDTKPQNPDKVCMDVM